MMNISVQLCGLVFDLVLIFFIVRHEGVGLYGERIFKKCLFVYSCCIILDILSVIAIENDEYIAPFVIAAACKMYLISLMASAAYGFVYSYSDIEHLRDNRHFKYGITGVAIIGAVLIAVLPVSYFHSGRTIYSYGPSAMAAFVFAPLFIISSFLMTVFYGKQMNTHKRRAIRAWMILEMTAATIQFIFPQALLVGFGSSLGLFILYSELENPEAYLDKVTGCFSAETFKMYVSQEYMEVKQFSSIIVCNSRKWKLGEEEERRILVEMTEYLHSFGSKLFRIHGNDFVLIYDKKEEHEMNEIESAVNLDVIRQRFKESWGGHFLTTKFLYIPDSHIASSLDEYNDIYSRYRDTFTNAEDMKTLDDSTGQSIREYRQMILEIKDALSTDRVEVFYQPIYSIATDTFVSAEALARIRGKDGKLVMPGKFIPVAEETGLIEQIGERVFERTCECIKEHRLEEMGIEYVEVNLSVSQCENPMLSTTYDEIMKSRGVTPSEVNLEITESSTLNQRNILLENMNKLMNLGCRFSLDDFGTGESNLNYIMDMPVNIVKFDRSMVQEYFNNDKAKVVITNTVNMIKQLGLKTVAEGVETEEQVEGIKALGIDYIQGFYYSKPLSTDDFIRFINEKNSR